MLAAQPAPVDWTGTGAVGTERGRQSRTGGRQHIVERLGERAERHVPLELGRATPRDRPAAGLGERAELAQQPSLADPRFATHRDRARRRVGGTREAGREQIEFLCAAGERHGRPSPRVARGQPSAARPPTAPVTLGDFPDAHDPAGLPALRGVRICFVGKYPPIQGGVSAQTYWAARGRAGRGHEVFVVTNAAEVEDAYRIHLDGCDPPDSAPSLPGAAALRAFATLPAR